MSNDIPITHDELCVKTDPYCHAVIDKNGMKVVRRVIPLERETMTEDVA